MPLFIYENPKTGEIKEIIQSVHEKHEYKEKGLKWNRVFTVPNMSIDSEIDPFNSKDFVKKTSNKSETIGAIQDRSKELSEKRAAKLGYDPVKENYHKGWSKLRKGRLHPDAKPKVIENSILRVEL